jgi:glycosyltransferase involved in cell wall biosynthesis
LNAPPDHTFAIPAYGRSPHLEDCLRSLVSQTRNSEIVVATSTPFEGIDALCARYGAALHVHGPNRGIAADWNAAFASARGRYVTLAHQDDVYYPRFTEATLEALGRARMPLLAFTDYVEIMNDQIRPRSSLLRIKRILLELGYLGRSVVESRVAKTTCLRFACPIPCPAVTLDRELMGSPFDDGFQINLDWAAWLRAARTPGAFVWVREALMGHRIHAASETSNAIFDGRRRDEDGRILGSMWPAPAARAILASYRLAYSSNKE